ncbi:type VII secretion integral membrane protein EccD [Streptomyces sp. DSM 44917]|uniref:Type VII secretion integral membrane protein EccD n=1 Tax=Streptomyces boetiae TaxID=3075541 RepID=A0ABU2LFH5_9ACTN|nr:type VII secretion integral membrane protein EccD [Streptomyces sp. DSM 44917]MDT0310329.1 type VII secretion integral membrane protein EccD [Streptomyces sp. DSM 44917]
MSTAATGFCRVTVVAPDSRTDLALPDDVPLADLYPEILRLTGRAPDPGAPVGYHLVRRDGGVLDGSRTLEAQRVLDGEVLTLRPFADSLPPPVHDDVTDAVAEAVAGDRRRWDDRMLAAAGLSGAGALGALTAAALWLSEPDGHHMHGLPGVLAGVLALLLASLAVVRARVYGERAAAVAFGLAALPHALVGGSGLLPPDAGHGAGRLELLLGCVAALLVAAALAAAVPEVSAWFAAGACAAALGALAAFGAIVTEARPAQAAAVCLPVAVGALAFLPGLAAGLVRLPVGYLPPQTDGPGRDAAGAGDPVDPAAVAARARRGHQLLLGLTGGCALVATVAVAVLGAAGEGWGRLLALAASLALLTRARLFRYAVQVAVLLAAGLLSLALLVLGYAADAPADGAEARTLWLAAALAAGAGVLAAVALIVPRAGLTPFWGRALDLAEGLVLLSLIPLCLAALDVYAEVRSLTG